MKIILFLIFGVISGLCLPLFPCTVFYATDGNIILFGNNEDWSDSNSRIWFIPSERGKHGWIKLGWNGGFPQGGMNEYGLCWDATSCAYLGMPYSEANKEKYPGPLMMKVIEECATVEEASAIFATYYCEDQYKAQYLLGDTTGASMIVEGDSIIVKSSVHQILTNFYHSHPELGGYPCWRYETAASLLENCNEISPYLLGSILSATHQEGRYPTQYSGIYDLKKGIIYMFYYHNFEEFITINLKEELNKGSCSYDLPKLFSKIQIISPKAGQLVDPSSVIFKWKGKSSSHYDLYYSTDPDFTNYEPVPVMVSYSYNLNGACFRIFLISIVCMVAVSGRVKKSFLFMVSIVMLVYAITSCKNEITSPSINSDTVEMTQTIENLEHNKRYYWKLIAHTEGIESFSSESIVQNFTTSN